MCTYAAITVCICTCLHALCNSQNIEMDNLLLTVGVKKSLRTVVVVRL